MHAHPPPRPTFSYLALGLVCHGIDFRSCVNNHERFVGWIRFPNGRQQKLVLTIAFGIDTRARLGTSRDCRAVLVEVPGR